MAAVGETEAVAEGARVEEARQEAEDAPVAAAQRTRRPAGKNVAISGA
jgi:hypothetical protein